MSSSFYPFYAHLIETYLLKLQMKSYMKFSASMVIYARLECMFILLRSISYVLEVTQRRQEERRLLCMRIFMMQRMLWSTYLVSMLADVILLYSISRLLGRVLY